MDEQDKINMENRQQQQQLDRIQQETSQHLSGLQPSISENQETRDLTRSVLNLVYKNVGTTEKEKEKVIVKDEVEKIEANKKRQKQKQKQKREKASGSADQPIYDDPESHRPPKGKPGRPPNSEEARDKSKERAKAKEKTKEKAIAKAEQAR